MLTKTVSDKIIISFERSRGRESLHVDEKMTTGRAVKILEKKLPNLNHYDTMSLVDYINSRRKISNFYLRLKS